MKAMKDEDELPITCLNAEDTPAELLREVHNLVSRLTG